MIRGLHAMIYTSEPDAVRAFLRDKLQLPHTDVGDGWLIFQAPRNELGVHPSDESRPQYADGMQELSFYCDDIAATVAELSARGVEFIDEVTDQGYGLVTHFRLPGDLTMQLYQPRYSMG